MTVSTTCNAMSALCAAALASVATAQDFSLPPTFGVVSIATGFVPDPNWVSVLAGGNTRSEFTDVADGGRCAGYFANAPDMRVHYTAGDRFPFAIYVDSRADTVLLVNTPDGQWHCNDDTVALNPAIEFDRPLSGQYDIWVGTFSPTNGTYPPATLAFTEISAFEASDFSIAFFGEDDRIVVDADARPWNMIGFVDLSSGSCSGTLIGPSTVLTAAHCLANGGVFDTTPVEFLAGYDQGQFVARSAIVGVHVPQGWLDGERRGNDFAFLFLADPIGERLGWMEVGPLTAAELSALEAGSGPEILQAGYSYDQQGVLTGNIGCPFVGVGQGNELFHECDTLQGDSGSPLFIQSGGGYRIIGVESHARNNPDPTAPFHLKVATYSGFVVAELAAIGRGAGTLSPGAAMPSK